MRYASVAEHRGHLSVRALCRCLRIQPSGFYAWGKASLSKRSEEDDRQTELLKEAWVETGKVYGHRKLPDDVFDQGKSGCLNRIARRIRLAGITAQNGRERRPGKLPSPCGHRKSVERGGWRGGWHGGWRGSMHQATTGREKGRL